MAIQANLKAQLTAGRHWSTTDQRRCRKCSRDIEATRPSWARYCERCGATRRRDWARENRADMTSVGDWRRDHPERARELNRIHQRNRRHRLRALATNNFPLPVDAVITDQKPTGTPSGSLHRLPQRKAFPSRRTKVVVFGAKV